MIGYFLYSSCFFRGKGEYGKERKLSFVRFVGMCDVFSGRAIHYNSGTWKFLCQTRDYSVRCCALSGKWKVRREVRRAGEEWRKNKWIHLNGARIILTEKNKRAWIRCMDLNEVKQVWINGIAPQLPVRKKGELTGCWFQYPNRILISQWTYRCRELTVFNRSIEIYKI